MLLSDTSASNISIVYLLINAAGPSSFANSCLVSLTYSSSVYSVDLMNQAGTAWMTSYPVGQAGTDSNSQCTLSASGSSVQAVSGTELQVNFAITFQPGWTGAQYTYTWADDFSGNASGWIFTGIWVVGTEHAPSVGSVTPSSGSGSRQTFSLTLSDPDGQIEVSGAYFLMNTTFSAISNTPPTTAWPSGCQVSLNRYAGGGNLLYLLYDDGTTWLGPLTVGVSGSVSNSQCTLYSGTSSISGSGNNLTLNLDLGFPTGSGGYTWTFVSDWDGGISGWTSTGSWNNPTETATINGPSWLQANLGYLSFANYTNPSSSSGFTTGCPPSPPSPANLTVRSCIQTVLSNLRKQGVSGVRVFVPLCESSSNISPITNCGQKYGLPPPYTITFSGSSGPGQTWVQNAGTFFADVAASGIQNVTITIVHGTGAPTVQSLPSSQTTSPALQPCADTPSTVYFYPSQPFGNKGPATNYAPIGQNVQVGPNSGSSQGYNCAATNPWFIGWTNQFNAINALLGAARGTVNVYELEFEQELNIPNFTVLLRYFYDNAQVDTYTNSASFPGCSTTYVDSVCVLRALMTSNGFDPLRVSFSAVTTDAQTLPPQGNPTGPGNCLDIYGDYARNFNIDQVAAAFGAGLVGLPTDACNIPQQNQPNPPTCPNITYALWCGGANTASMQSVPLYHSPPDIVDVHAYPNVSGTGSGDTQVEAAATVDFNDLQHFMAALDPSALLMIGETFTASPYNWPNGEDAGGNPCPADSSPSTAASSSVAGFNASAQPGYSTTQNTPVVFRPWMILENNQGACFPYTNPVASPAAFPSAQSLNLNWAGPYAPANH